MSINFPHLIFIALGGATGAVMRYLMSNWVHSFAGRDFPYGTLSVNVLGSFLMGILYILLIERFQLDAEWRALILVGLLGAFTTFSTFSMETLLLLEGGEYNKAIFNIFANGLLCIAGAWAGVIIGRQI